MAKSSTVYFVTDQYREGSIKSFEREKRGATGIIRMKVERRTQACPRQWKKFLGDAKNKTELIRFLLNDWKTYPEFIHYLSGRTLFFNVESKFYKLSCNGEEVVIFIIITIIIIIISLYRIFF